MNSRQIRAALFILISLFVPAIAFADTAPVYPGTNSIGPTQESPIAMDREIVTFTFPTSTEYDPNVERFGAARATFWLSNPTDRSVSTTSIFPFYYERGEMYALPKSVSVHINDKPVAGTSQKGTFPIGKQTALKLTSAEGYVFPLSVGAHETVKVDIDFKFPFNHDTHGPNLVFKYVLASGAGWAGAIGSVELDIIYPYPAQFGSVRDGSGNVGMVSGNTVSFIYKNVNPEPGADVEFSLVPPELVKDIVDAQQKVELHPKDPAAHEALAAAYHATGIGDYWRSALYAYILRHGSTEEPETGEAVLALAKLYYDDWSFGCEAGCTAIYDFPALSRLLTYTQSHVWKDSDQEALAELRSKLEADPMSIFKPVEYAFLPGTSTKALTVTTTESLVPFQLPDAQPKMGGDQGRFSNVMIAVATSAGLIGLLLGVVLTAVVLKRRGVSVDL